MTIFLSALPLIILTTAGQILLKKSSLIGGYKNPYLWTGYTCLLLTLFASLILMRLIEFKYFTVIMSMNYMSVTIASSLIFKEGLGVKKILGICLVVCGMIVFSGKLNSLV